MLRRWMISSVVVVLVASITTFARGAVAWDENENGDLSSDPNAPTVVSFSTGSNIIDGTVVAPADTYDYLTFTLAPGQSLTNLLQMDFVDIPSGFPGNTAFHAIIAGPTSFVPDFDTIEFFMGANHMDPLPAATDVLPDLANAVLGGSGFTLPLGPGTYTYHVQQVDASHTGYTLDFVVAEDILSADFDEDGDIDGQDFLVWQQGGSPSPLSSADLLLWQEQYGSDPGLAALIVPEPGSLVLAVLIAVSALFARR